MRREVRFRQRARVIPASRQSNLRARSGFRRNRGAHPSEVRIAPPSRAETGVRGASLRSGDSPSPTRTPAVADVDALVAVDLADRPEDASVFVVLTSVVGGVRLSAGSRLRHVMEGIPRGEAESPKAMPWQGCGCALRPDVRPDRDGIPSARVGSIAAKRESRAHVDETGLRDASRIQPA